MTRLTPTRPAAPQAAGRFPFTDLATELAEDPTRDPTRPLPREYDANGHFALGPKLRRPSAVSLIGQEIEAFAPEREKAPAAEHRREVRALSREAVTQARLRRSVAGGFAPVRRRRPAAA